MIQTKSIFEPASNNDGMRLLITRFHPRGITKDQYDEWVTELAPSVELLLKYKDGKITWEQFAKAFKREIIRDRSKQQVIKVLRASSKYTTITLLCYEKDGNCHRHIVKALIENGNKMNA